jgi:hypothetical protein
MDACARRACRTCSSMAVTVYLTVCLRGRSNLSTCRWAFPRGHFRTAHRRLFRDLAVSFIGLGAERGLAYITHLHLGWSYRLIKSICYWNTRAKTAHKDSPSLPRSAMSRNVRFPYLCAARLTLLNRIGATARQGYNWALFSIGSATGRRRDPSPMGLSVAPSPYRATLLLLALVRRNPQPRFSTLLASQPLSKAKLSGVWSRHLMDRIVGKTLRLFVPRLQLNA